MRLNRIVSFVLLMFGVASAFADPGNYWRDAREAVRAYHIQSVTLERSPLRDQQQGLQPPEHHKQGAGEPESSGYGSAAGETQSNHQQANNQRRPGRMTLEERRALRRQIDEAGHDIYSRK